MIGGSHTINQVNEDVQYGDLSAVLLQNSPFWGHWIRTPELHIALLDEWENKIEQLAENTISENVTSISGVPTWTLVLMKRILEITGKKISWKSGHHWNCIFMAGFRLLLTVSNLQKSSAGKSITLKCTMPVKVFLQHRIIPMKTECCYLPTMEFLWSSCRWKNMENRIRRPSDCRMLNWAKIMRW